MYKIKKYSTKLSQEQNIDKINLYVDKINFYTNQIGGGIPKTPDEFYEIFNKKTQCKQFTNENIKLNNIKELKNILIVSVDSGSHINIKQYKGPEYYGAEVNSNIIVCIHITYNKKNIKNSIVFVNFDKNGKTGHIKELGGNKKNIFIFDDQNFTNLFENAKLTNIIIMGEMMKQI
jgi:hypothetical protein